MSLSMNGEPGSRAHASLFPPRVLVGAPSRSPCIVSSRFFPLAHSSSSPYKIRSSNFGAPPLPQQDLPSNRELGHRPSRYKLPMANPVRRASMAGGSPLSMPLPARTSAPPRGVVPNRPAQFMIPRFIGEGSHDSQRRPLPNGLVRDGTEEDDDRAFCGMYFLLNV
jgi:hypothetical protein